MHRRRPVRSGSGLRQHAPGRGSKLRALRKSLRGCWEPGDCLLVVLVVGEGRQQVRGAVRVRRGRPHRPGAGTNRVLGGHASQQAGDQPARGDGGPVGSGRTPVRRLAQLAVTAPPICRTAHLSTGTPPFPTRSTGGISGDSADPKCPPMAGTRDLRPCPEGAGRPAKISSRIIPSPNGGDPPRYA